MDKYDVITQIGDGTFGSVAKGVLKKTGQLVAIKKMKQKFYTWEECVKLPEVDVVRRIHGHPNIVKLREVIRENNELFFVFEYMDGDLLGVIKKAKLHPPPGGGQTSPYIPYSSIKLYMRQILQSLVYIHKRGYFHRDMKPENLLIRKEPTGEELVKLADFGLVKEIRSRPPFTDYVSTRWYRAPELLLQDRFYSSPVDIWAAGCIMAELITTRPLFPGTNEVDQLFKIMSVLGAPTERSWPGGMVLARKIRYNFPSIAGSGLARVLPSHTPPLAADLIGIMLTYDPKHRLTAEQCLQHPFFESELESRVEPSAAVLDQLAGAAKRLQTGPQSSPPPPLRSLAADIAVSAQKAGRATADGPQPDSSPRKYYMIGTTADTTPSLKPLSSLPSPTPASTFGDAAHSMSLADTTVTTPRATPRASPPEPVSSLQPPLLTPTMRRISQDALTSPALKKLVGLKNAPIMGGRRPLYNGASPMLPTLKQSPAKSYQHTTSTNARDGKSVRLAVAQQQRRSGPGEPQTAAAVVAPHRELDLDELMEELAPEGTHIDVRDETSSDLLGPHDSVAALLNTGSSKKLPSATNEVPSLQSVRTTNNIRGSVPQRQRRSEEHIARIELPRMGGTPKGVSPSLQALLAKHKPSAFAYQ